MGLQEVIAAERERYIAFFVTGVSDLRRKEVNVATELLIAINDDKLPYPYRYFRADVVATGDDGEPKLFQLASEPDAAFEPTGYNFGAFQVELYPFAWDNVQIVFDKAPSNLSQLEGWMTRWLDIEESGINKQDELDGAIHAFSQVETNSDWSYLTADFGTAPADALVELIELLAGQGMTRIVLKAG